MQESEAEFMARVAEAANLYGWRVAHFREAQNSRGGWMTPVQFDAKGFPDLLLVRDDRLLLSELKSAKGKLTELQKEWLDLLRATGKCEVYCWFPDDWENIVSILT